MKNYPYETSKQQHGKLCWLVISLFAVSLPTLVNAQNTMTEAQNKQLIQQAFDQWAAGRGNFFDLLTDEMQWTITGSSPFSKTYTSKTQLIDQAVTPLSVRLAKPIVPTVRALYAEGDVVTALWDGTATAKDGKPYHNTYCWIMTLQNGRIINVVAFLDLAAYVDVLNRIPAGK